MNPIGERVAETALLVGGAASLIGGVALRPNVSLDQMFIQPQHIEAIQEYDPNAGIVALQQKLGAVGITLSFEEPAGSQISSRPAQACSEWHTVTKQDGQWGLWGILHNDGTGWVETSPEQLGDENGLKPPYIVHEGDKIHGTCPGMQAKATATAQAQAATGGSTGNGSVEEAPLSTPAFLVLCLGLAVTLFSVPAYWRYRAEKRRSNQPSK